MAVERRSALTKASTPDDPLAGMGVDPGPESEAQVPSTPAPAASRRSRGRKTTSSTAESTDATAAPTEVAAPRPVGRPRTRPVQVTFSSKVDLEVRAHLDAWEYETGETIVDLLDRGLRAAMGMPARGAR